ncbi:MAG: 5-aminolevulic acid synthase [Pseudomonadota bacterium]
MRLFNFALAVMLSAGAAKAEPMSGQAAAGLLFEPGTRSIQLSSKIADRQRAMVGVLVPLMEKQLNQSVQYYGAFAISPDEGFQADSSQSALNYHSVAAADRAALSACNARRKSGSAQCVLAARILPEGYKRQPLSLSTHATRAFRQTYRQARAPKALAISAATGAFGVGAPDAALQTCQREAGGVNDCAIVIRD